jgi:hypothetical protein
MTRILKKQAEFNKGIQDAGLAGEVPIIRWQSLKAQGREMAAPDRSEMIRLGRERY